jgi:hypothetical protein
MGLVTISFKVPSYLINEDNSVARKYQIVRVHEGEVSIIDAVFNEDTGEISFETDKFSTYALIYTDAAVNVPPTGDTSSSWSWIVLMIGMLVLFVKAGSVYKFEKK